MVNLNNKNKVLIIIGFIVIFFVSMIVITLKINADEFANKVMIDKSEIKEIITGTAPFDEVEENGNDISSTDRIVRSFDKVYYNVEFSIKSKNDSITENLEDRIVDIIVQLSDEDIKYLSFSDNNANDNINISISNDKKTAIYSVTGVNNHGTTNALIEINVNSAPNGYEVKPTFKIKEETDEDEAKEIMTNSDIINYMPTIVSSKSNIDIFAISSNETQTALLNNEKGRFVTFGLGLKLSGDNSNKGIKGLQLPKGNIAFDIVINSSNGQAIVKENYIRAYTNKQIENINPIKMSLPYSMTGDVNVSKINDSVYHVVISNYSYIQNINNADGTDNDNGIFMSLAVTAFSKRTLDDGKNDINISLIANNDNLDIATDENGKNLKEINLSNNYAEIINKYQEDDEYLLEGTFINRESYKSLSNQIGEERHYGSTTKGDEIAFQSNFKYKNSILKTGISQIIKIDPDAYELTKLNDKDYDLIIDCEKSKCNLTKDDFNVRYVTGEFKKENYEVINYDDTSLDKTILTEDTNIVKEQCLNVKNNYENLNKDQIMNLYGGPCLKAKDNVEEVYNNIEDTSGKKITKIILETNNKNLDNQININFIVGLRVRNVADITRTYQATTLVKSKNNKNTIYFNPSINFTDSSISNYNNYIKTIYSGVNAIIDNKTYADSLKIVNYTARNNINITNTNKDKSKKTRYNLSDKETLNYKIDININDYSQSVGAEDVWYIKNLNITVNLSKYLEFKPNDNYLKPIQIVNNQDGSTTLIYSLPYTKTNRTIQPILFDAEFKKDIKGNDNEVIVTSRVDAINVNDELDTSSFGSSISKERIYVTGLNELIISEDTGSLGNIIDKDEEFNYKLNIYNNSDDDINNLSIMDIMPYTDDELNSYYSGTYKIKLDLPDELKNVKIYCFNDKVEKLSKNIDSNSNIWESCDITNDYINVTAIKIDEISVKANSKISPIILNIKPNGNEYDNRYNNRFYAKSENIKQISSSIASVRVINRKISGQVFKDVNENGINDDDIYMKDIQVSLCKLDSSNECKTIKDTKTNENGEYLFDNLDVGTYKINLLYDFNDYDVTNRYFTSDESKDSDAYKISSEKGKAEISGKENGIVITKNLENVSNMDMGLISKKNFQVDIKKGINKVELNEKGEITSYNYDFLKTVQLSVRNINNLTGKVTYGFEIINTSEREGYVNMIEENIPDGMTFNPNYEQNKKWFSADGKVYYDGLKDILLKPGDHKKFEIVLDMYSKNEARVFLNEVSIIELTPYEREDVIRKEEEYKVNNFELGSSLDYALIKWHVIDDDGTNVTLLADENEMPKMAHLNNNNEVYKWSSSNINKYINSLWITENVSLDKSVLIDREVCDDASGLQIASYGGTLKEEGTCLSGLYNNYKVRLLTKNEFDLLISKLTDVSFLIGTEPWYLMNSNYEEQEMDEFGNVLNDISNTSLMVDKSTSVKQVKATNKLGVRPVITVSKLNILLD